MKLIIQIPCYNEEENIEKTIKGLPKKIKGIDEIEYLLISDGSTDNSVKIAKNNGVHHILDYKINRGLAKTFMSGISKSLSLGADIIVNIDGDNQYSGDDIKKLVEPIIQKKADMVIGEREINKFPFLKRLFQKFGSWVVRKISNTDVKDAPSGFRAYSRECAMKLNVYNNFTYTLETIIQLGRCNQRIVNIKINSVITERKSRLFKNNFEYMIKSMINILKAFFIYMPMRTFFIIGTSFLSIFVLLCIIFSIVRLPILIIIASMSFLFSVISYLFMINSNIQYANRILLEDIQYSLRKNNKK